MHLPRLEVRAKISRGRSLSTSGRWDFCPYSKPSSHTSCMHAGRKEGASEICRIKVRGLGTAISGPLLKFSGRPAILSN